MQNPTHAHVDPLTAIPRMVWILRFATALHKLRPGMSGPAATSVAKQVYRYEMDRQPEVAAAAHADLLPASDGVSAMDHNTYP